jgi:putative ABC transport system permease protein
MLLARKALRDLRAMGLRALMIVLVIGAGAGTAAGIALALEDVRSTRDAFYSDQALADLDLRLRRPVAARELRAGAREVGATAAELRLIADGEALVRGGDGASAERPSAHVVGMPAEPSLNRLALLEGEPLTAGHPSGAVLEADFAEEAGIEVGERLRLEVGGRPLRVRIRGIARSPEYLVATANPEYLLPARGSLAVVFLPRSSLQRTLGEEGRVNDLAVDLPAGAGPAAARKLAAGLPVQRLTPRERQFSLRFTDADIKSFGTFSPVMGAVFAIVGFLLVLLSLRRLVHSQRRELGAMLALGYRRTTVALSVMLPAAVLAACGALLSIGVTIAVGELVAAEYSRTVGFPEVERSLAAAPLAIGAAAAAAATLLAAAIPSWRVARMRPTEAMRGEAPTSFALPGWLERATAGAGLALAYASRTLLRRPLLTGATVLSMGAAIGLGAAMNVVLTSTVDAVDSTFASQRWTHSVDLARPLPRREARAVAAAAGARGVEPVAKGSARLAAPGGASAEIDLVAIEPRPPLQRFEISSGGPPPAGSIMLSEQTAAELDAAVGDGLRLTAPDGAARVEVSGVARTLAGDQGYILRAGADSLLGVEGAATNLLVAADQGAADRLRRDRVVGRVTSLAAARHDARELVDELTALIDVLLAISLGVGALFLVSSLTLSFLDRQGEFATLRALGHGRRQIAGIVAGEALAQALAAAALSVPLGLAIAWPLSEKIGEAWFRIGIVSEPPDFTVVILPALILALLAAAFAVRRVLRLDIARAVRARLVG